MYKLLLYLSANVAPFPLYVSIRKTTVNMNGFGSVQIELIPLCGVAQVAPPTVVNKMICGHAPHADDDYQFTSIARLLCSLSLIAYPLYIILNLFPETVVKGHKGSQLILK